MGLRARLALAFAAAATFGMAVMAWVADGLHARAPGIDRGDLIGALWRAALGPAGVVVLLCVIAGAFVGYRVTEPVGELEAAAARRARRAARIAAWRDIARRIAHEIKNPLSPIQVAMETLRKAHAKDLPDFDEILDESTTMVLEEVQRMKQIVDEFSRFARMPRPKPTTVDLDALIAHVTQMVPEAELVAAEGVRTLRADRDQLTQVLVNLAQNGAEAARARHGASGARVEIRVEGETDGVLIALADNGPGLPLDERERVFEPYYTTKPEGTGLGLAIVQRIVEDHGGHVEVQDGIDGGAEFVVWLSRRGPVVDGTVDGTIGTLP